MGVDLGGADVGVAEHGLDGAEVGAVHEEVGGEAVTEGVGGDVFGDASHAGVFLDDALDGTGGKAAIIAGSVGGGEIFAIIEEKRGEGIGAGVEVILDALGGGFGNEDWAVFAALAADDELAAVEVDGVAVELDEFGDAETAREKQLDNGAVAQAGLGREVDGVEEILDFVVMKESDLLADDVGELDEARVETRDATLGEILQKAAKGDEMVSLSDGFEILAVTVGLAVESEAELADQLKRDVSGDEVEKVVFGIASGFL